MKYNRILRAAALVLTVFLMVFLFAGCVPAEGEAAEGAAGGGSP